jgi:hypothetical protein
LFFLLRISNLREQYEDALDKLFAEAHMDFDDPFTLRFMYCEALFTHGYFNESLQLANILSTNLINHQPTLLISIVRSEEGVNVEADVGILNSTKSIAKVIKYNFL